MANNLKTLSKAERFFYDHAGYSYDAKTETAQQGRIRCARAMAIAEEQAANLDWCFCWEPDEQGCIGCDCKSDDCKCSTGEDHETLCCLVRDYEGNTLASLGGICGATPQYSRVVEAELACEALYDYDRETEILDAH